LTRAEIKLYRKRNLEARFRTVRNKRLTFGKKIKISAFNP